MVVALDDTDSDFQFLIKGYQWLLTIIALEIFFQFLIKGYLRNTWNLDKHLSFQFLIKGYKLYTSTFSALRTTSFNSSLKDTEELMQNDAPLFKLSIPH